MTRLFWLWWINAPHYDISPSLVAPASLTTRWRGWQYSLRSCAPSELRVRHWIDVFQLCLACISIMSNSYFNYVQLVFQLCLTCLDNTMISDMSLRALGKVCRDLRQVYLAGCSRITDHGMKALGTLRQLQMLNVADCIRYNTYSCLVILTDFPY